MTPSRGNRNAFKHGFYARNFSHDELLRLKRSPDLVSEIKAARIIADRIFSRITETGLTPTGTGLIDEDTLKTINTLGNVLSHIATLARSHQLVTGKYAPVETAILDALHEINALDGYDSI